MADIRITIKQTDKKVLMELWIPYALTVQQARMFNATLQKAIALADDWQRTIDAPAVLPVPTQAAKRGRPKKVVNP